jgi:hypothetical protein
MLLIVDSFYLKFKLQTVAQSLQKLLKQNLNLRALRLRVCVRKPVAYHIDNSRIFCAWKPSVYDPMIVGFD